MSITYHLRAMFYHTTDLDQRNENFEHRVVMMGLGRLGYHTGCLLDEAQRAEIGRSDVKWRSTVSVPHIQSKEDAARVISLMEECKADAACVNIRDGDTELVYVCNVDIETARRLLS